MRLKIVVFGLSLSSSWGNGHATTWRALLGALAARGHDILFLERDQPWYAAHRDMTDPAFCKLRFYDDIGALAALRSAMADADLALVGSYVPDGAEVVRLVQHTTRGLTAFYDIDTPVTLAQLESGSNPYLDAASIPGFDIYFSFTGGPTLEMLGRRWGARRAVVLYCSVDPAAYRPAAVQRQWDLGYVGTYSPDRQPALDLLLLEPARRRPELRFVVAGPQYPSDIAWPANVDRIEHLAPGEHAAFYSSLGWTLNITRAHMRAAGWSPSVRLFEAAACATPIVSDIWDGIEDVLSPGSEVTLAHHTADVLAALAIPEQARLALGMAARRRVLSAHTGDHRAIVVEAAIAGAQTDQAGDSAAPSRFATARGAGA
jgi:spore maturation protein CgeB